MKLGFFGPRNPQDIIFRENASRGSRVVPWGRPDGQVGMTKLVVAFSSSCELRLNFFFFK